jgi:lipoyl(octanoyl) transferase
MGDKPIVRFADLKAVGYQKAWDLQEKLLADSVSKKVAARANSDESKPDNYLLFCEHEPVFTLGKSGKREHLLLSEEELIKQGIVFFPNNRGGDITYHGPGQITGYPIFDLEQFTTDIGLYLRNIEESVIRLLAKYGIPSGRIEGLTGVWIDPELPEARKICAIGVRASRWVTMHGFAFNVNTNMDYFDFIIPCGIRDKGVTSMEKELGFAPDFAEVKSLLVTEIASVFNVEVIADSEEFILNLFNTTAANG